MSSTGAADGVQEADELASLIKVELESLVVVVVPIFCTLPYSSGAASTNLINSAIMKQEHVGDDIIS